MFENFRLRIDRSGTADDDSEIVFRQAVLQTQCAIFFSARTHIHGKGVDGARAGHHGVTARAQEQEQIMIVRAAEGNEVPMGRRDFAVGGGGDVQINEGQAVAQFRL